MSFENADSYSRAADCNNNSVVVCERSIMLL